MLAHWGWKCAYCRKMIDSSEATVDHIIPHSQEGGNNPANLAPSCKECNISKGSRSAEEFCGEWQANWIRKKAEMFNNIRPTQPTELRGKPSRRSSRP